MPIDIENEVTERISSFSGIKSSLPFGVLQSTDAEDILNFVSRRGRLRKIWGASLYYESGAAQAAISWLAYFGDKWIAQHGDTIIREFTEGQANFNPIGGMALGAANKVDSEKWENRIYLTNGVENKYLEDPGAVQYTPDENFLTLGLIPPGRGAKNWNGAGAFQPNLVLTKVAHVGSTLADATYGYVITFWDANREIESLPNGAQVGEDGLWASFALSFASSSALAFTMMTDNAVRVDISALKAAGYDLSRVTHFIVYRQTQADVATLKRVADPTDSVDEPLLRIANNFYDDSTVEANLGAVLDESLSPPPSGLFYQGKANSVTDAAAIGPRFFKFFRDQLWAFGVRLPGTDNGTKLQPDGVTARQVNFAKQSGIAYASMVNNHEYWTFDYNIGRSTAQRDTGMGKHRNVLMFFKEASAYYLSGSSPDNYEVQELDPKRGINIPGSLQDTTLGVIGLSVDGFTRFDGVGPGVPISEEIFDKIQQINLAYADKINSVFDPLEEKYECHVPLDEFGWNVRVFSFDCKTKCWEITNRAGGSAAYGISSSKRTVSLLGDPRNGRLYRTDDYSKVTFNGQTMFGHWRSKAFDFGHPGKLKNVQFVEITANCIKDFRLSVDLISDFGQADSASVEDIDPDVRTGEWAADANDDTGLQWNSGQWEKGVRRKKFTVLIQSQGKNFNLAIRNSDTDAGRASFEIEEIVLHASLVDGDLD